MNKKCLSQNKFFNSALFVFSIVIFQALYATEPSSSLASSHVTPSDLRSAVELTINHIIFNHSMPESVRGILNQALKPFESAPSSSDDPALESSFIVERSQEGLQVFNEKEPELMSYIMQPFIVEDLAEIQRRSQEDLRGEESFTYFDWLDRKEECLLSLKQKPLINEINGIDVTSFYQEIIDAKLNNIQRTRHILTEDDQLIPLIAKSYHVNVILLALRDIMYNQFKRYDFSQKIFEKFQISHKNYSVHDIFLITDAINNKIKKCVEYCSESAYIQPRYFKYYCEKNLNNYRSKCNEKEWFHPRFPKELLEQALIQTREILEIEYLKNASEPMLDSFFQDSVLKKFWFNIETAASMHHFNQVCPDRQIVNVPPVEHSALSTITDQLSKYLALKTLHDHLIKLLSSELTIEIEKFDFLASVKYYEDELKIDPIKIVDIPKKPKIFNSAADALLENIRCYYSIMIINPFYLKILCYDSLDKIITSRFINDDLLQKSAKQAQEYLNRKFFSIYHADKLKKSLKEELLFFVNKKGWSNFFEKKINKRLLNPPKTKIPDNDTLKIEWKDFHDSINPNSRSLYEDTESHFRELTAEFNNTHQDSQYQQYIKDFHLNKFKLELEKKCVLMNIISQGNDLNIPNKKIVFQSSFFNPKHLKECLGKKIDYQDTPTNKVTFDSVYQKALSEVLLTFIKNNPLGDLDHPLTEWAHDTCNIKNLNLTETRDELLRVLLMHLNVHQVCKNLNKKSIDLGQNTEVKEVFKQICTLPNDDSTGFMRPAKNMKTILSELPTTIEFMEKHKLLKNIIKSIIKYRNEIVNDEENNLALQAKIEFDYQWMQTEQEALHEIQEEINEYFLYALKEEKFSSSADCWNIKKTIQSLVQERKQWLKLEEQFLSGKITSESFEEKKKTYSKLHDYRDYDPSSVKDQKRFSAPKNYVGVTLKSIHQSPHFIQSVLRWCLSWHFWFLAKKIKE